MELSLGYSEGNIEEQHTEFVLNLVGYEEPREIFFLSDGVTLSELCFIKINLAANIKIDWRTEGLKVLREL